MSFRIAIHFLLRHRELLFNSRNHRFRRAIRFLAEISESRRSIRWIRGDRLRFTARHYFERGEHVLTGCGVQCLQQ